MLTILKDVVISSETEVSNVFLRYSVVFDNDFLCIN